MPPLKNPPTPLAGCEYVHSPVSGLILYRKPLGARIRPGEVVAEIVDPVTDHITPLVAEFEACYTRGTGPDLRRQACWC